MQQNYESDLCRLCLQNNDELMSIFWRNARNGLVVAHIISDLFEDVVSWEDKYPKSICKDCYSKLMGFHRMKAKYSVHTLPSFVLFRNQYKIVQSTIDYAKSYNISTPDFQHSPLSSDHSPFSLQLEELVVEDELNARRAGVDKLLESVAEILKTISNEANILEDQSADADNEDDKLLDMLALPGCSFVVDTKEFSSVDITPVSLQPPITLDNDEAHSLVVDGPVSSSPIREEQRCILRIRELKHRKEEANGHCSGEVDVGKIKRETSPTSAPSPQLGRLLRKTKFKQGNYEESSCENELKVHQPNNYEGGPAVEFDCAICFQRYSSWELLRSHMQEMHLLKDERVNDCDMNGDIPVTNTSCNFNNMKRWEPNEFASHQEQLTDVKDFICVHCGMKFFDKNKLSTHIKYHIFGSSASMILNEDDMNVLQPHSTVRSGVKGFKCGICGKEFVRKDKLRAHTVIHENAFGCDMEFTPKGNMLKHPLVQSDFKVFKCEVCGKQFTRKDSLKRHTVLHENSKPWKCNICGKNFAGKRNLLRHSVLHDGVKAFKCDSNVRKGNLKVHTEMQRNLKSFKCEICGKEFRRNSHLKTHTVIHGNLKPFKCDICGKEYYQKGNLVTHSAVHTGVKPFKCGICGRGFPGNAKLRQHSVIHGNSRPYSCDTCGKQFKQRHHLLRHSTVHSNVKPFKCDICGKEFSQKENLKAHSATHIGGKQFKCDDCGRQFSLKGHLLRHSFVHMDVKPFKCDICEKVFVEEYKLKAHSVVHGAKLYKCDVCPKEFFWKRSLLRHSVIHSEVKPFKCDICGEEFSRKDILKTHAVVHGVVFAEWLNENL